jgi:acetoin utilization protein AcuB
MKTTKNLMHKNVITIKPDESLLDAYKIMKDKNIRHLPVVDINLRPIGILSDRDIQRAMINKKLSEFQIESHLPGDITVSDFMSWPVYTIGHETSLSHAAKILIQQKVSCLVVENSNGQICGILTTEDLLGHLLDMIHQDEKKLYLPLSHYF